MEERQTVNNVNLRRMVVLIINTMDTEVSCTPDQINNEMWKNVFSCKIE